ncbi:MAG: NADH-quinone oxidoreductase subunit NuoG [Solirubrobacterales bacterium]
MTPPPDTRDWITFTIDGREVRAPQDEWLLEAAKRGDVEIPFFCYERKLVDPVGACRMCLVEIEGIPKLQTSCSTPVKDGMVVHTETDRVKQSQRGVVEFLLVNHPLDCPVCDKGGECPLQDISFGWGDGHSRVVDPKRVFPKPIALSPLVAIDRERCILCYRCVRFSQEVSEDHQLAFLERGDHTFVGTFDGHPYVAPFSGNITELCPVGALTSTPYRFRARPWDIEQAGSICTLCPSQCNVSFTVRDERVERVLARDNDEVDNGWLCDKGRYSFQTIDSDERITQPLVRDGGFLRPASWDAAMDAVVTGLTKAGAASAAVVGGSTTNEEGYLLQRIFREALGSGSIDSRTYGGPDLQTARLLGHPKLSAAVADIDGAGAVLVLECDPINEAPILDLRIRKAVRHFSARLVTASSAPTALDGGASERLQFAPGGGEALLRALQEAMVEAGAGSGQTLPGHTELAKFLGDHDLDDLAGKAGVDPHDLRETAKLLAEAQNVVIVWGERLARSARNLSALGDLALTLGLDRAGSGLLEIPAGMNGRGLREVGCVPDSTVAGAALDEARAFYLLHSDPLRELPGQSRWDRALAGAGFVVAHAMFMNRSVTEHADVVFPAESHAEKDGTVTHPDGRIQRVRPAIGHRDEVRMEWQILVELANRLGLDLSAHVTSAAIFEKIAREVPFYAGITLDQIAGKGIRWTEREQASAASGDLHFSTVDEPAAAVATANGALPLTTARSLWASWETDFAPPLRFLRAEQVLVLSAGDADRLGLSEGDPVEVASNGDSVRATACVRSGARPGTACMIEGTAENSANLLYADGAAVAVEVRKLDQVRT